ncbi:DUF6928 family protein [Promicromonospora thailandica]|uniref:Uncharacterized protein n=1 Tax=Promicromonospora thailandica TaxID=765201 RepID=A0A9X2JUL6_9MICO|nr:hypothetical protein [Promicromonospora thailandica]MCP2263163.1 hypothetical protein [Promicromonospora thailandica]BFF18548.1 hypothetical protein GCM10025730_20690 [Promicromonospora thailandica]
MGAKTAMLVYADGDVAEGLSGAAEFADEAGAADLLGLLWPPARIRPDGEEPWDLGDALFPPQGRACALSTPEVDVLCDQALMLDRPSQLPAHLVAASVGRTLYLHAMHSAVDWFAFAVWRDGALVRSLSVSPEDGVLEDAGERLAFEEPFWAGDHPAPAGADYPLPFHPLALGGQAASEFFGFDVQGADGGPAAGRLDPWAVELFGFQIG